MDQNDITGIYYINKSVNERQPSKHARSSIYVLYWVLIVCTEQPIVSNDNDELVKYVISCGKDALLPLLRNFNAELPNWLTKKYLKYALEKNPKSGSKYRVPFFYVLYKLHKLSPLELLC